MRKMERLRFMKRVTVREVTTAAAVSAEPPLASVMRQMMRDTKTGCISVHGYIEGRTEAARKNKTQTVSLQINHLKYLGCACTESVRGSEKMQHLLQWSVLQCV